VRRQHGPFSVVETQYRSSALTDKKLFRQLVVSSQDGGFYGLPRRPLRARRVVEFVHPGTEP